MNIAVIGTGYVGLVSGACFAELGLNVICVDKNLGKVNDLKRFKVPIYEKDLEPLITKNHIKGRLEFTTDIKEALKKSDVLFISVGTPGKKNGSTELKYLYDVINEIANNIEAYKLIVVKSTVPVGTCRKLHKRLAFKLLKLGKNIEFDIASNPEFLREGNAVYDFFNPDRIVVGTDNKRALELMKKIYEDPVFKYTSFIYTNHETSELIKYASNAFLATKISFINEIANMCELCGADISVVAKGMGLDKRIGSSFLNPGPGYGGSCFPKDIDSLFKQGETYGYKLEIIKSVKKINLKQKLHAIKIIESTVGDIKDKNLTVLGGAYKPETDDIRESPAVFIIEGLLKKGARIKVYDPKAMESIKTKIPENTVEFCEDEYQAAELSDCIIIATEWEQFKTLNLNYLKEIVRNPVMVDLKNMFEPQRVRDEGFIYKGTGRK